tara:strand:+ start:111 stop:596 length:486 start_codon:yes stop_codon:yes gene_type:complete
MKGSGASTIDTNLWEEVGTDKEYLKCKLCSSIINKTNLNKTSHGKTICNTSKLLCNKLNCAYRANQLCRWNRQKEPSSSHTEYFQNKLFKCLNSLDPAELEQYIELKRAYLIKLEETRMEEKGASSLEKTFENMSNEELNKLTLVDLKALLKKQSRNITSN